MNKKSYVGFSKIPLFNPRMILPHSEPHRIPYSMPHIKTLFKKTSPCVTFMQVTGGLLMATTNMLHLSVLH